MIRLVCHVKKAVEGGFFPLCKPWVYGSPMARAWEWYPNRSGGPNWIQFGILFQMRSEEISPGPHRGFFLLYNPMFVCIYSLNSRGWVIVGFRCRLNARPGQCA